MERHIQQNRLETIVIVFVIAILGLLAMAYDMVGLYAAYQQGGMLAVGRGISAVALGWMCAWCRVGDLIAGTRVECSGKTVDMPDSDSILIRWVGNDR